MSSFVLRGVDTALWTAARQACKAEKVDLVWLVETKLVQWLSDEPERTARKAATKDAQ